MSRHNRTYTVLLIAVAFLYGLATISTVFMSRNPAIPPESRLVFQMAAWMNAALVAAMVVTLILRRTAPATGRIATQALNIVRLIAIPFGPAVGIYGLMKVDKDAKSTGA